MKAKFVYEAISDVFKPKSDEEIISLMNNLSANDLLMKSSEKGFLVGVKKALEMGANIHAQNDYSLVWASINGHYDIVELLLKHGANVHAQSDCALQMASRYGHYDIVELLLKHGANVHARNNLALRYVSAKGHKDLVKLLKKYM